MSELILFLFATAGGTFIVTYSSLFKGVRDFISLDDETWEKVETPEFKPTKKQRIQYFFGQLVNCPLCFGFWMGIVMYFFMGIEFTCLQSTGKLFAYACAGSGASFLFYRIAK
tara:strand:+ start:3319 stop:3657 length:339 start_codon:yes stop_codon:yes gene_type:complete